MALCIWKKYNAAYHAAVTKICTGDCEGKSGQYMAHWCVKCLKDVPLTKWNNTGSNSQNQTFHTCSYCGNTVTSTSGSIYNSWDPKLVTCRTCGGTGTITVSSGYYTQGTYLTTVTAEQNTYPRNGQHTDGYWYVYQGLANKAPTISGTDTNLGTLTELEYKYSINDTDPSDTITVFERLDGTQLRTFTATRDIEYTIKPIWVEILNGIHTLTITATDNIGASTVRTITFAKAEHELEFTLQTPLPADDMVTKTIMSITREIPAGAVMQIYVCNNGFDEIPTWEDITAKVVDGDKFFFANTTKTAAEWGYNIRICVQRLGADVGGTIFITSVGGNFE